VFLISTELPMQPPTGVRVCVIGSGYVGLTAAVCFAHLGHTVLCADVSADRVEWLRSGGVPDAEAGLAEILQEVTRDGRLSFTTSNAEAVSDAEFTFLCLPTPDGGDGRADLSFVVRVAEEIGPFVKPGSVIVNKSTVPVGTARIVRDALMRPDVDVVSNPEFLAEGTAVHDFLNPDRVVVGADSPRAAQRVADLYSSLGARVIVTDAASSEMIKYAANAFLATKLSFVNSLADLCEATGADIRRVTEGMGADDRIGASFLRPGPGWGGSCFPKDTKALLKTAQDVDVPFAVLAGAIEGNDVHIVRIVEKVEAAVGGDLVGVVVALWGLTFKAGTNDMRDSPARALAAELLRRGAIVQAFDPTVNSAIEGIDVRSSALCACEGAAVLLLATEWPEFARVPLADVVDAMNGRAIVDGRNLLDAETVRAAGIHYEGVGLPGVGSLQLTEVQDRESAVVP
jgi:UDPglucose 6-dehydrogenase